MNSPCYLLKLTIFVPKCLPFYCSPTFGTKLISILIWIIIIFKSFYLLHFIALYVCTCTWKQSEWKKRTVTFSSFQCSCRRDKKEEHRKSSELKLIRYHYLSFFSLYYLFTRAREEKKLLWNCIVVCEMIELNRHGWERKKEQMCVQTSRTVVK